MTEHTDLGVPATIRALLFDLDGVLTKTATLHAKAWKTTFDGFLDGRGAPFTLDTDYAEYVDGKPRIDGVRSFLGARGIALPEGDPDDSPTARTVHGLANRKNQLVLGMIRDEGVQAYEDAVEYLRAVDGAGMPRAVVSSSANCHDVLVSAGIDGFFQTEIDGRAAAELGLAGKPAPDTFLAGAEALGVEPAQAAVLEDALAGVAAGRAGNFGVVVGVDRANHGDALLAHGADLVVAELTELLNKA
ncbi:MAG: beta-phosphoglucomutase family hydrolase [Kutzneria sp.]|nr:beta-phosphoglucomutase family hydrolase [Kutzneria sp.]